MKKKNTFRPGMAYNHRLVKQVNSLDLNQVDKYVLHHICQFKSLLFRTDKPGSEKYIQPHVGFELTNEDMISSIKTLATLGYIIPVSKGRKWGALQLVFDVDTFKLQGLYEDGLIQVQSPF